MAAAARRPVGVVGEIHEALTHVPATWALDVETARSDLGATRAQATVVAAHALAWRSSVVLVPLALLLAVLAIALADANPVAALLLATLLALFGPQFLAALLTFPVGFWAEGQSLFRGRDNYLRFGVIGNAYPHYGWRYAFCGRTRQWGALTHEERVAKNPQRAGVSTEPPPRRNYWPE